MANVIVLMKIIKHLLKGLLIFLLLLAASCSQHKVVRFGICADVHKDVMHDEDGRNKTVPRITSRELEF